VPGRPIVAEGKMPTANLLAPVVVNLKTRRGLQAIQVDSSYSHQHPVLAAGGRAGVGEYTGGKTAGATPRPKAGGRCDAGCEYTGGKTAGATRDRRRYW